ncbi:MAG: hypothetical protein H6581_10545 [Bacteroidia bacterium]|nr:hypothetical protein [Bacteroidia bacterium]
MQRTMESIGKARILLYVYDVLGTPQAEKEADLEKLRKEGLEILVVGNKWDQAWQLHDNLFERFQKTIPGHELAISAKENNGIDQLKAALLQAGVGSSNAEENVIISNLRHYQALRAATASLSEAENAILAGLSQELVAIDIRHAIHHLGSITGEITTDEVLGNIFSKFCIGK